MIRGGRAGLGKGGRNGALTEQQLRDGDTGSSPLGLLRPESRSWVQARPAGGPTCYHGDAGLCPDSWGDDPPPQLNEDTQRAETSLKAKCPPTPPFSGTTCFALKLGTLTWEVFSSCWPPDVLPAHPPPTTPKHGPGSSCSSLGS